MQDYDTVLKLLLRSSAGGLLQQVTQVSIRQWLNVELPKAQQLRVDLLGQTESGSLEHIELQSQNQREMPVRMLEYRIGIYRQYKQFPRQTLLYCGHHRLTMPSVLETEQLSFRYNVVDASELDGEALLASEGIGDNVLAILAHVRSQGGAIRRILERISHLDPQVRQDTFNQLLIISGLRELEDEVKEEARKMPITDNILDHKVIGPAYRSGMQQGLEDGRVLGLLAGRLEGRVEGRLEGRLEGERAVLRKQLEKRFGPLSATEIARLDQSSIDALEDIGIRLLDASSLEELLP